MDIEKLIKILKSLTYKDKGMDYDFKLLNTSEAEIVEREIRNWAAKQEPEKERKQLEIKVGQLEAKCLAYEAIIQNSNFAPVIKDVSQEQAELKGAEE